MNDVATPTSAITAMSAEWDMACALLGGTKVMRMAGIKYLPKWPGEEADAYRDRVSTATLYPAYSRTIKTLAGKPFSKPITIGADVPAQLVDWSADMDMQGRNLHAFASEVFEHVLGYGLSGILVDYPDAVEVKTKADEMAQGLRPYCVHIKATQILGWRSTRINGVDTLTQLRYMEQVEVDDGPYGTKTVDQVRVLLPGSYQLWQMSEKKEWVKIKDQAVSLNVIPFVPFYGDMHSLMRGRPPLVEMGYLNIEHWQSASDQQTILHVARVPILTVDGIEDEKFSLAIGAGTVVKLPTGCVMKYVEHTGAAIKSGQDSLNELEDRMRQAGAELLQLNMRRITATQIHMENELGMCALQRIAQSFEDGLDKTLELMSIWAGLDKGGHVALFSDYGGVTLSDSMAELLNMELSNETRFEEAQRRGILSPDLTWEDEYGRLELQGPSLAEFQGKPAGVPGGAPGDSGASDNSSGN